MPKRSVINVDLANVWAEPERLILLRTMAWGDEVSVIATTATHVEIATVRFEQLPDGTVDQVAISGYIVPTASSKVKAADTVRPAADNEVLRVNFIDVQQGDAAVIESPDGKVILVDGGENQLFARYLAGRFRGTTANKPKTIDCIVVTHGDADHFSGLPKILESETNTTKKKQLFIRPLRVFHNGIVKRPSKRNGKRVPDKQLLGPTAQTPDGLMLTGLVKDLLQVPDDEMNKEFVAWKRALAAWNSRHPVDVRRIQFGDDAAFDWFNKGTLRVEVLGPLTHNVNGEPGVRFLGNPPTGPRLGHDVLDSAPSGFGGASASHTINGHSIVLRLGYGGFSYLFTGDLNDEASRYLASEHNNGNVNLRSEVLKVPHHGSADFSGAFLQSVSPVVSIVSSGDESVDKEYIHPRATLVGALGRFSRFTEPLVFVTELVAFFKMEGNSALTDAKKTTARGPFFGFSRAAWGSVKTRTDGSRLLVFTDSANVKLKEAYAYQLDASGVPAPSPVVRV